MSCWGLQLIDALLESLLEFLSLLLSCLLLLRGRLLRLGLCLSLSVGMLSLGVGALAFCALHRVVLSLGLLTS
jgi:hypothetical protein